MLVILFESMFNSIMFTYNYVSDFFLDFPEEYVQLKVISFRFLSCIIKFILFQINNCQLKKDVFIFYTHQVRLNLDSSQHRESSKKLINYHKAGCILASCLGSWKLSPFIFASDLWFLSKILEAKFPSHSGFFWHTNKQSFF